MLYVTSLLANAFRCFVRRAFKYKTSTADVIFGLGSEQEMCLEQYECLNIGSILKRLSPVNGKYRPINYEYIWAF